MIEAYQAYRQIEAVLQEAQARLPKMELPPPQGNLAVENVYFQPPGLARPVLQRVSFALQAGEAVGVIGPSESGRATCRERGCQYGWVSGGAGPVKKKKH